MARSAALVTSWTHSARGREAKALESFADYLTFFGKKAADGKCTAPEPFFSYDGSTGFAIVKGSSDELQEIVDSEEYEKLIAKAQLCVEDLRTTLFAAGEEEVQRAIRIYSEAGTELGYL